MTTDVYVDMRNLASPLRAPGHCPVSGCSAALGKVPSQWGEMPHCPVHRIRIHVGTRTFVYYHGSDEPSRRDAALRNILFERDYFGEHVWGNDAKAETNRICYETSEDALTWNVFSRLATSGALSRLLSTFTHSPPRDEPELYLWGLRIRFHDSSAPQVFPPLERARGVFERDITKFPTEPDIMLFVPGQVLVLVEAKFTSGNTIAASSSTKDGVGEKPQSREDILRRYSPLTLPPRALLAPSAAEPFYSQLYRNLVFAIHMATELGVGWGLVSLVCDGQFRQRQDQLEFRDASPFIHAILPEHTRDRFVFYSWERLYSDHVAGAAELEDLAAYMRNKSANGATALAL